MTRPTVIVIAPADEPLPPLARLNDEAEFVIVRTAEEFRAAHDRAEILFSNDFRTTLLRDAGPGNLRWIHACSIGVDALVTDEIVDGGLVVTNTRGVFERPIAEWILGVLLMFAKDIRRTIELQRERRWLHRESEPILGRRVLVVGPGPVGRETVLLLRAAGMNVTVVGRTAREDPVLGAIAAFAHLDDLLADADDVVLALPLTAETQGLFDATRIAKMKVGARLINVGRGATVVERDLIDALWTQQLGAAALDVFEEEPLPQHSPLWDMSTVLVSPHCSGDLVGSTEAIVEGFAENLRRWKAGEPLRNVVDLEKLAEATRL